MVAARSLKILLASAGSALLVFVQSCVAGEEELLDIRLPPGFSIEVYAEVPNARSMALGPHGTVFVGSRRGGSVYAVVPRDSGKPEVVEILSGLDTPNGVAFFDKHLYVAETTRILRYDNAADRMRDMPPAKVLPVRLPGEKHHGSRYIGFGPDQKLYVSIGAPCNVCERDGFARIVRMNPDGSEWETFATGVRNSVGFTWHPTTGELWFTDNGRDMLGDDLPPCELNHAPVTGLDFGFPYCHGGEILDPQFGDGKDCAAYRAPARNLGPHVAPLGVRFYSGSSFPEKYRGQVFIAEHGSWNRSKKIGYRISLVQLEDGVAKDYSVFADGWLQGQSVSGRPVDLLVLDDGSMLVSDDHAGKIYTIRYQENER